MKKKSFPTLSAATMHQKPIIGVIFGLNQNFTPCSDSIKTPRA